METEDRVPVLPDKRLRVMRFFVEAAQRMLQDSGLGSITIRKVASAAGYNSATIYRYFSNLEHLILYASTCYLRDYTLSLSRSLKPEMNALERYRTVYQCFNDIAFLYPDIFHNMFFGKCSHLLGEVLAVYYGQLYPEELNGLDPTMRRMLTGGNMADRDAGPIRDLVKEGFLAPEKARSTMELIIALHQSFLYDASIHFSELDIDAHTKRFNCLFEYLLEQGRPDARP